MKRPKPTSAQVAKLAGVSKWTVIRAFDPDASIHDGTRERVRAAAESLGYHPNLLARSLARNKTNLVAVLIDDFTNLHKLPLIAHLSLALQREGKMLIMANINEELEQIDALIHARQWQVDGVVLFANSLMDSILEQARAGTINVPLVMVGRESTLTAVPSIAVDARSSMIEMGRHLLARGYRRPGYMSGPEAQASLVSRYRHFAAFWQEQGGGPVPVIAAGSYDRRDAEAAAQAYLERTPPSERFDALLCENDNLALGALDVVKHRFGLSVPRDLAVAGYDDIPMAAAASYDLTSYEQPVEEMVARALDILAGRLPPQSIDIAGRLVARGST